MAVVAQNSDPPEQPSVNLVCIQHQSLSLVSIMKIMPGQGVLCLTQPLGTPLILLGDGQFQEPKAADPVCMPDLGPFPSGLVQVQRQGRAASSPREGAGTAELCLVPPEEGRAFSSCRQLAGSLLQLPEWRKSVHNSPMHKGSECFVIRGWGTLGAPPVT